MRIINRTVWILSIVSMLADVASEMLYPIIPVYLKEVGFSILLIGILEGIAEFTVGVTKGYFGQRSDQVGLRLPFVKLGYLLSAVSKPLMAVWTWPLWIFIARTSDRLGKGVRTAARDAMLSQQATIGTKARVFGFHRMWDTLGAVIGPLIALVYLQIYPTSYQTIFFLAFFPGIVAVLLVFLIKEQRAPVSSLSRSRFFSFFRYWNIAPTQFKRLMITLVLFSIANSSDVFLILKTREITGSDSSTITCYILYNIAFAAAAFPLGVLGDRIGLKKILAIGILIFSLVYAGFIFGESYSLLIFLFVLYGIYAAATQGITKAWVTNLAHETNTATAIGLMTTLQSVSVLFASIIGGLLWTTISSEALFIFSSSLSVIALAYLLTYVKEHSPRQS